MKRKKLSKAVSVSLACAFALSVITGCQGDSGKDAKERNKTKENSQEWEKAASDPFAPYPELVTYTLGKDTQASPNFPQGDNYENNGYTRYLKEKLNVQNENLFEAQSGDDYDRKVSLAITSGELPDIMTVSNVATLKQLVENDLVEDLTESYKNCASDAIKEIYDSFDGRSLENATFDGKLMAIPSAVPGIGAGLVWLRQDWLDKLNLEGPKTLEELEHILQEFVTKDPGGNGKGKTIGLAASEKALFGNYGALNCMDSIFAHFNAYPKQWMEDEEGKVYYGSTAPKMKEALALMADWYKKGLIDPQMVTRDTDDMISTISGGQAGAFLGAWYGPDYPLPDSYKLEGKAKWKPYVVAQNEDGSVNAYNQNPTTNYVVVRKGFEHPELAIKILNQECWEFINDRDSEHVKNILDNDVDRGTRPLNIEIQDFDHILRNSQEIQSAIDGKLKPEELSAENKISYDGCKMYFENESTTETLPIIEHEKWYVGVPTGFNTKIHYAKPVFYGQTDGMKRLWTNMEKLEDETMLKIITNVEPVDSFDSFVETWKSTGGDQVTREVEEEVKKK